MYQDGRGTEPGTRNRNRQQPNRMEQNRAAQKPNR